MAALGKCDQQLNAIAEAYNTERARLAKYTPDETYDGTRLGCLQRILDKEPKTLSECLNVTIQLRDVLEPLRYVARRKTKLLKETKPVRLGAVQGLSRRLAPYSKPPPEYSDWSGVDSFCVPGYMFPCPDNMMIMRSLFYQGGTPEATVRCLPPTVEAVLQPNTTTLYKLRVKPTTAGAQCFVSVQFDAFRPVNEDSMPELTAPGDFSIQAYSTALHYLPSEVTVKLLKLRPADTEQKVHVAQGNSLMDSLFWGEEESDEEE